MTTLTAEQHARVKERQDQNHRDPEIGPIIRKERAAGTPQVCCASCGTPLEGCKDNRGWYAYLYIEGYNFGTCGTASPDARDSCYACGAADCDHD